MILFSLYKTSLYKNYLLLQKIILLEFHSILTCSKNHTSRDVLSFVKKNNERHVEKSQTQKVKDVIQKQSY